MMTLHERMKELQTDSDVKIRTLAARFKISENVLGNYLNGKRHVPNDILVEFAKFYHVTTDYLLGLTDDPNLPFPVSTTERAMLERFRSLSKDQKELIHQSVELMFRQNQR